MQVLQQNLLPHVVGGSYDASGESGEYGGNGGSDGYGSYFGGGFFGGDSFASVGGFDSNGVGATSCVPTASSGLFGFSFTETLAGAGAVTVLATGLGQGYGASLAIEAAGGLAGVGQMGSSAAGLMGSAALGLGSALIGGGLIGTVAYHNSETVRDISQAAVGGVLTVVEGVTQVGALILGIDRASQPVFIP